MNPALSRADLLRLLRLLEQAPQAGQAAAAAMLGWEYQADRSEPTGNPPLRPPTGPALQAPSSGDLHYLARRSPRYWRVVECRPETPTDDDQADKGKAGELTASGAPPPPPPQDQAIAPLRSAGQWQNLWDRLPPRPAGSRRIDLRRSVTLLARAQPLQRLPRKPRHSFSRAVTLILDRPDALRPVWDDMSAAWRSLHALLGDELQGFHLPSGPDGAWLRLGHPGLGSRNHILSGATVVLIGAFGALQSGQITAPWRKLLDSLRSNGHRCLLVPVCPLNASRLSQALLDPAAGRATTMHRRTALDTLLAALSHTWLPAPARLRHLRQAIPNAGLHTELLAWNHPWVARNEFHLGLRPERLLEALHRFNSLEPALRESLQQHIDAWPLDAGARDIERLQQRLLAPGRAEQYPQLQQQGLSVAADPGRRSMALGQFCSMLPVLEQIHRRNPGKDWQPLLQAAQQLARATHRLPPEDKDRTDDAESGYTLRQRHHGLVVAPAGTGQAGLLTLGPEAWCPQTGQWAKSSLAAGLPVGLQTLELLDRGHRWRLRAEVRPGWAQRAWVDGGELFAAHAEGALFQWQPASPERPLGSWQPSDNSWDWAAQTGVDEYGLWAMLAVDEARYRLRWVPPGEFMMGTPEDEEGRDDDETQHRVRLTQGYWLGETAVTQALWQVVTGKNPSGNKGDALPVEQASWDDCQDFIQQMQQRLPGLQLALPTEAQWEYACRAGSRTAYWWGDELDQQYANNGTETRPETDYPANPFGLRSMSGNVWEWCADGFAEYPEGPVDDPTGSPARAARRRVERLRAQLALRVPPPRLAWQPPRVHWLAACRRFRPPGRPAGSRGRDR